jgi:nicotinamidase-related amidase
MSETALLVVDMMNSYEHSDAEHLARNVEKVIDPLARLIAEARRRKNIDLIYVNDNYGDFATDHKKIIQSALNGGRPDLVRPILPQEDYRFLMKVRHSAFYSTALGYLLRQLEARRVVITGQVTEQCILYTALDAHVRHFSVVVPTDAVAHIDADLGKAALKMMEQNMNAEIAIAADCLR